MRSLWSRDWAGSITVVLPSAVRAAIIGGGWAGMAAHLTFENKALSEAAFSIVRQNDAGEVLFSPANDEGDAIARMERLCAPFGTKLRVEGTRIIAEA